VGLASTWRGVTIEGLRDAIMDENNAEDSAKQIPLRDLRVDPAAEDLLDSAAMEPYLNLAVAMMGGKDTRPAIEELAALPLEKRYVWRVASALKWAFVDFDSLTVEADRQTITPKDREQLADLVKHRPLQFCLFLSTLFGQKQMELMMLSAIKNTRAMVAESEGPE
jgi:hypothetical protein